MPKRSPLSQKECINQETGCLYQPHQSIETPLRIALAYPNTYYIGMSNLGFQLLYRLLNEAEGVECERVFYPDDPAVDEHKTLTSFESQTLLNRFDIIAFSISYELDYPNIVQMLKRARIPVRSQQRTQAPLIIGGGACITMNPEPLAPFFDLLVLGEGEAAIRSLITINTTALRDNRAVVIQKLATCPGFFAPATSSLTAEERVSKRLTYPKPAGYSQIITAHTEFSRMFLLEISRGCKHNCSFCLVGTIFSPYRPVHFSQLQPLLDQAISQKLKIGLVAANPADHPNIEQILQYILAQGGSFSTSSLKISNQGKKLLPYFKQAGCQTITIAPESASQRLLNFIRKGLSVSQITDMVAAIYAHDISNIKMYFLLGIPGETPEDLQALGDLIAQVDSIRKQAKKGGKIIISINPLIPKPHTALASAPAPDLKTYKQQINILKKQFAPYKAVQIHAENKKKSLYQAWLASGDREMATVLEAVALQNMNWSQAFKKYHQKQ